MMRLPGLCIVCRQPVTWTGRIWAARNGKRHVCPKERPTCGAWMPLARQRCARRPGHRQWHRTREALDNACAWPQHRRDGVSVTPTHESARFPAYSGLQPGRLTVSE